MLRCREGARDGLRRAKQRMLKFLLRRGRRYESGGGNRTVRHWRRTGGIESGQGHGRAVYEEYRSQIRSLEERLARLEGMVKETAESPGVPRNAKSNLYKTSEKGLGKKKTIVSVGRRMAVLMYSVLRNKTVYEPRPWKGVRDSTAVLAEQAVCA